MESNDASGNDLPFLTRVIFRNDKGELAMGQVVHNIGRRSDGTPIGRQHAFDIGIDLLGDPTQWCPVPPANSPGWKTGPRYSAPHGVEVLAFSSKTGHAWMEANDGPLPFPGFLGTWERFQGATAWMEIDKAVELAGGWRDVPKALLEGEHRMDIQRREGEQWATEQAESLALAMLNDADFYHLHWSPLVKGGTVIYHRYKVGLDDWTRERDRDPDNRHGMMLAWTESQVTRYLKSNPDAVNYDSEFRNEALMRKLAAQQVLDHYASNRKEFIQARQQQEAVLRTVDRATQAETHARKSQP